MSYEDKNVASNPGAWGLRVVAEIEYSSGSYEFDTRIVWADSGGVLYTARDSGCSCPTPFEDYREMAELERFDYDTVKREVAAEREGSYSPVSISVAQDFLRKLREAEIDPASVAFNAEAEAKRLADEAFRTSVVNGLRTCRTELAKHLEDFGTYNNDTTTLANVVIGLQQTNTKDILTLGVYLTRMAEAELLKHAADIAAAAPKVASSLGS